MRKSDKLVLSSLAVAFSFVMLFNTVGGSNIYAQIVGNTTQANQTSLTNQTTISPQQANQTSGGNQTTTPQQAQQQIKQANQNIHQAQEQKQQAKQQLEKSQSKNITAMSEKLLNFTNSAIIALDHKDTKTLKHNLAQLQSALINATGKQVVIIPSEAVSTSSD